MDIFQRKYGVQDTILIELIQADGVDLRVDAVHAAGDTTIMKDEGAPASTDNPFADEGDVFSLVLTATELTCKRALIVVRDQSVPKVWLDKTILVETFGHASAQFPFDLGTATQPVNVTQWNGTAVAAPATAGYPAVTQKVGTGTGEVNLSSGAVPIQAGTGTGQLDFTSGVVKANLAQILGTALTETAGLLAAGFKQFFNIASPTSTMNTITTVTTTTNLTNAPSDSSGVTTLLSRLSATRAGYLDNLSAGAVALQSKLLNYVRLLARKDSAVATDAAAEVTEINANAGSGAGAYANTTDAQEALRDRGDAAWITATGFATSSAVDDLPTNAELATALAGGVGSVSGNVGGNVVGSVASVTAGVTVTTNNDKTGYTLASLSTTILNQIADRILRRTTANIEASGDGDALSNKSLYGVIARLRHKNVRAATTLTTYKSDGVTSLATETLTTDSAAEPVISATPN